MRTILLVFLALLPLLGGCGAMDKTNNHLSSMDNNTAQMQEQINQMNQQMGQLNQQILTLNQQLAPLAQFGALSSAVQNLAQSLSRLEENTSGAIVSFMNLLSANTARSPETALPTADDVLANLPPEEPQP